jgi:hypothetical protein
MPGLGSSTGAARVARAFLAAVAIPFVMAACDAPFGIGLPTTRALENGAAGSLSAASSVEISGSYRESGTEWSVDLQLARPSSEHVVVSSAGEKLEAISVGGSAYFRGQAFLAQHLGSDPASQSIVKAAGNAWWTGLSASIPVMPDLTDGGGFRSAFLGSAVTQRSDHVSIDGVDAVDLAGPRAEVFIASAPPYRLVHLRMKNGVVVDGIGEGDLRFGNYGKDFAITAPNDVIDFSNLSTLPPVYTVVSVDSTRCGSPCVVSATLKNLGGATGAVGPSSVTFTITGAASGQVLGTCAATVQPDVGYNSTTKVSCTIAGLSGQVDNAATVTATPTNPGRG